MSIIINVTTPSDLLVSSLMALSDTTGGTDWDYDEMSLLLEDVFVNPDRNDPVHQLSFTRLRDIYLRALGASEVITSLPHHENMVDLSSHTFYVDGEPEIHADMEEVQEVLQQAKEALIQMTQRIADLNLALTDANFQVAERDKEIAMLTEEASDLEEEIAELKEDLGALKEPMFIFPTETVDEWDEDGPEPPSITTVSFRPLDDGTDMSNLPPAIREVLADIAQYLNIKSAPTRV